MTQLQAMARILIVLMLLVGTASAQPVAPDTDRPIRDLEDAELFDALGDSASQAASIPFEREILRRWHSSGSETVDLLLSWSSAAMNDKAYALALDLLDRAIALKPGFAESWNKRATVHFLNDDYSASISDIERTLKLEPRHFGALSGLGLIMRDIGENDRAVRAFEDALAIHPHLKGAKDALEAIEKSREGQPI